MAIFQQDAFFWRLIQLIRSLSTQTDHWKLYSDILDECQNITHCDGATLYVLSKNPSGTYLKYALIQNTSLCLSHKHRHPDESALPPIRIQSNDANRTQAYSIAAHCALEGRSICVEDVYRSPTYNTSGIKAFDDLFNYRTRSVLSVPVMRSSGDVLGVIQLINPQNPLCGAAAHYSDAQISIIESLSTLLAILLDREKMECAHDSLLVRLNHQAHEEPLFERIVDEALALSQAEGAAVYWLKPNSQPQQLTFALMKHQPLKLKQVYSEIDAPLNPLPLTLDAAAQTLPNPVAEAARQQRIINIQNAYDNTQYDLDSLKAFDAHYRYHTQSILYAPLMTSHRQVVGVLQLMNAQQQGQVIPFPDALEPAINALTRYAATVLEQCPLYTEAATPATARPHQAG